MMEAVVEPVEAPAPTKRAFTVEFRYCSEREHQFETVHDFTARDALTRFVCDHENDEERVHVYRVREGER